MSEIFLVAAEASGDRLGASLMAALKRKDPSLLFRGVGGDAMAGEGLASLYPMTDLSVFGFADVIKSVSRLRARIRETVEAVVARPPAALILIDSFGLSFRIAKRVRKRLPQLPIIKYVAPQVWVWRQYRAAAMKPYFDHTLALFPFEPEVHRKLGGPPCTYIGHPILEELPHLRPDKDEAGRRNQQPPIVVVMPGSRRSELRDLMTTFGDVIARIQAQLGGIEVRLPTLPHLKLLVEEAAAGWSIKPEILSSEAEKFAAMRVAHVAIAASGTATLELGLAGVPHVGAYRIRWWEAAIARRLVQVKMALLPNILLNERVVPELLQEDCTAPKITDAVLPLFGAGPERQRQIDAFSRIDGILATPEPPSDRAAAVVLQIMADSDAKMR